MPGVAIAAIWVGNYETRVKKTACVTVQPTCDENAKAHRRPKGYNGVTPRAQKEQRRKVNFCVFCDASVLSGVAIGAFSAESASSVVSPCLG